MERMTVCPVCGGKGTLPNPYNEKRLKCLRCKGTGKIKVQIK